MKRSRGARVQAAVEKPSMASSVVVGVHGVAHLGADQGRVTEVERATYSFQSLPSRL